MIKISEIMSSPPFSLRPDNSMAEARQLMKIHNVRHLPVVDSKNCLVGIVSELDIHGHSSRKQYKLDPEILADSDSETLVTSIMSTEVVTVAHHCNVATAAKLLHQKKIGCLPVINQDCQLIGIVTDYDFVECFIHLLEKLDHYATL